MKDDKTIEQKIINQQARLSQIKKQIATDDIKIKNNKTRKKLEANGMSYEESCKAILNAEEKKLQTFKDEKKRLERIVKEAATSKDFVIDKDLVEAYFIVGSKSVLWRDPAHSRPIELKIRLDISSNSEKTITNKKLKDAKETSELLKETRNEIKLALLSIYTKIGLHFKKIGLKYWTEEEIQNFETIKQHENDLMDLIANIDLELETETKEKTKEPEQEVEKETPKKKKKEKEKSIDQLFDEL